MAGGKLPLTKIHESSPGALETLATVSVNGPHAPAAWLGADKTKLVTGCPHVRRRRIRAIAEGLWIDALTNLLESITVIDFDIVRRRALDRRPFKFGDAWIYIKRLIVDRRQLSRRQQVYACLLLSFVERETDRCGLSSHDQLQRYMRSRRN